jgi:hypothetical protein
VTDDSRIRELLLKQFHLRVGPEMSRYILDQLKRSRTDSIPVMGGDARTGVAVRQLLAAPKLLDAMNTPDTY